MVMLHMLTTPNTNHDCEYVRPLLVYHDAIMTMLYILYLLHHTYVKIR